eukprot:1160439-Pelagomonas_calceolata.AAC.7
MGRIHTICVHRDPMQAWGHMNAGVKNRGGAQGTHISPLLTRPCRNLKDRGGARRIHMRSQELI